MAAHLILALYWTHQMDSSKINRYIGLAHQSNDIISDSPGALVASLTFVSVILYDAKVSKKWAAGDERFAEFLAGVCSILAGRSAWKHQPDHAVDGWYERWSGEIVPWAFEHAVCRYMSSRACSCLGTENRSEVERQHQLLDKVAGQLLLLRSPQSKFHTC